MKIAPLAEAFKAYPKMDSRIVHTGQHYDRNMSALFFDELGIPEPDINLEVGSGSHARQTAEIMTRFEGVVTDEKPDAVLVVGDVNSTIACGLVASKLGIPLIHVEAGLRSFDRGMPEEINRVLTDAISDMLLVSEPSGVDNLKNEGVDDSRVHLVGNVMIDTLLHHMERAQASGVHGKLAIQPNEYGVITLHRPSNVDDVNTFAGLITAFEEIQNTLPLVFCMHPRTQAQAKAHGLMARIEAMPDLQITPPLSYLEFLGLMSGAQAILTDSGGMQEESTILQVPCLTLRDNTERPVTISHGTNQLVGTSTDRILEAFADLGSIRARQSTTPPLWDGQAAQRIARIIAETI
jgi:UDP-N-acetylglucosamine 2-epimerase (non-hydrolysing)